MSAEEWKQAGMAAGDVGGRLIDFGLNAAGASIASRRTKDMYRHRWRWAAGDMRKAGFNPILLTKSGPGASPSAALGSVGGQTMLGGMAERTARATAASEAAETTKGRRKGEIEGIAAQNALTFTQNRLAGRQLDKVDAEIEGQRETNRITRATAEVAERLGRDTAATYDAMHDYTGALTPLAMAGILPGGGLLARGAVAGVRSVSGTKAAGWAAKRAQEIWAKSKKYWKEGRPKGRRTPPGNVRLNPASRRGVFWDAEDRVWRDQMSGKVVK